MISLLINKPLNIRKVRKGGEVRTEKRIWLEGKKILKFFNAGDKLKIKEDGNTITIETTNGEDYDRKVSSRTRKSGATLGLIEINESNSELIKKLPENQLMRYVIKPNKIIVSVNKNTVEDRAIERESRLLNKLNNNEELSIGSIFAGGGTFDFSGHKGFEASGLNAKIKFAIDSDPECTDNLATNVKHAFSSDSVIIESDISLLNLGNNNLPKVEILKLTPPCTDSSSAAISKKKIKFETDQTAHLVYYYSQIIERCNPTTILLENVPNFANQVSFHLLTSLLNAFGYKMQLRVINAHEEGFSLETRKRMFLVAESKGLESNFTLDNVKPIRQCQTRLGDCLDYVSDNDSCWKPKTGLIEKEKRDIEANKGFRMQKYTPDSTKIGTLRAQYLKSGSSDPLIERKINGSSMFRLVSKDEHSRIKEIDTSFVSNTTEGQGHKFLGNGLSGLISESICYDLGLTYMQLKKQSQAA